MSAVAAIGQPERFFDMLRRSGLTLQTTRALPDHTRYSPSSFDGLNTNIILLTTKDAVKCTALNDDRLWAVRVTPRFSNTYWLDTIHETLVSATRHKNPDSVSQPTLN